MPKQLRDELSQRAAESHLKRMRLHETERHELPQLLEVQWTNTRPDVIAAADKGDTAFEFEVDLSSLSEFVPELAEVSAALPLELKQMRGKDALSNAEVRLNVPPPGRLKLFDAAPPNTFTISLTWAGATNLLTTRALSE